MLNRFSRTQLILGKEAMEKLKNAHVAVFGIGGVGGYVCEALVRSGVGSFDLIDDDKICLTNLNRQIIATTSTIGKYKADLEELKEKVMENSATEKQLFLYIRTTVLSSQESIDPEHTGKMCAVYFSICSMVSMRKEGDLKEISQTNRDVEQMCTLNH